MSFLSLAEYGLIGNEATAALISRLGSIDWCCFPFLDSPSHLAALLDDNQGGRFVIAPAADFQSEQRYRNKTNVLETEFETATGRAVLIDWMPANSAWSSEPVILRRIEMLEGEIEWSLACAPKFNYGSERATAERYQGGVLFRGMSPGDLVQLHSSVPLRIRSDGLEATAQFRLSGSERANFTWHWGRKRSTQRWGGDPKALDLTLSESLEQTTQVWRDWVHECPGPGQSTCPFAGPWHDAVVRSGLTLKLLTHASTGAIAEAVTTSLPNLTGGSRNWDYRYCWLRESAMAVQALAALGHTDETRLFTDWLGHIVMRDGAENLQPVYTLDGGRFLPERELTYLSGHQGSRPVRIGNQSARQFQLDIYGHVMLAAAREYELTGGMPDGLWPKLAEIAEYVCQAWRRPDQGPWEARSKPQHFVASKVYCWVALDRACRLSAALGQKPPLRWSAERDILHRTICDQGFDENVNSFVQAFGERTIDASALQIPLLGFLPFEDPRVQSTLDAVQAELSDGVMIHRYAGADNLPESNGAHLICSFWFISCLALSGRGDEASDRLAELCTYSTPLGMFAEQVNPVSGEPSGNFPSAAAHLSLINASLYVGQALGREIPLATLLGATSLPDVSPGKRARAS